VAALATHTPSSRIPAKSQTPIISRSTDLLTFQRIQLSPTSTISFCRNIRSRLPCSRAASLYCKDISKPRRPIWDSLTTCLRVKSRKGIFIRLPKEIPFISLRTFTDRRKFPLMWRILFFSTSGCRPSLCSRICWLRLKLNGSRRNMKD